MRNAKTFVRETSQIKLTFTKKYSIAITMNVSQEQTYKNICRSLHYRCKAEETGELAAHVPSSETRLFEANATNKPKEIMPCARNALIAQSHGRRLHNAW